MKYPALQVFLSEGQPRFELLLKGDKVDTVPVGRYDLATIRKLLSDLGLKRDEKYTWEKKRAEIEMEKAFRQPSFTKEEPAEHSTEL